MSTEGDSTPPEPDITEDFLGDISNNGLFQDIVIEEVPTPPEDIEVPPIDDGGSPFEDATTPIGDGACIVCGSPTFRPPGLTKAGHRKRVPKYCDLHAPNVRISQDGPIAARLESQLQRVQEELADDIRLGGTLVGAMFPVTGYYLFENADPFTIALIKLCKNNQRALRVLHRAASVAPVYEVMKDAAGVAYAIQVDQKKADPHSTVGRRLGVARAYDSVYPNDVESTYQSSRNNGFGTGSNQPPRYATVQ